MTLMFTKECQGQLCDPGETAKFTCATDMKWNGLTASWLKNNGPLEDTLADRVFILAKENHFSFELSNVNANDSGQYTCRVVTADNAAVITCSAHLEVHNLTPEEKAEREASNHPIYIVKLRDSNFILDSTASFMLHVKGNPNPELKFFKNDEELIEDHRIVVNRDFAPHGSYEIVIHSVQESDAGVYSAIASNSVGTAECSSTITVKEAKDIFALLKGHERTVQPGEEPTFTWFKSGQEFDPEDRFKVLFKDEEDTLALVFQHINPEDAGLYTCVASTSTGKISCSAELSVEGGVSSLLKEPEKPCIIQGLSDVDSAVGGSAVLEFKMRGYPRPLIQWSLDGVVLTNDNRFKCVYPDYETVALIINKVIPEDFGVYKAVLTNDLGEVNTEGILKLGGAPQFLERIEDQKAAVDEPWTITAKVSGNPELTWYKDGVPIHLDSRIKKQKIDDETFSLSFSSTTTDDNGHWAVIAKNSSGEMSQFFVFAAQMLPKFETKLIDVEVNEGKTAVFKVKIKCIPPPDVKWFRGETELSGDSRFKFYKDPEGFDCMTINSAARSMGGEFEVRAGNELGTVASKSILKVNTKPSCDDLEDYEAFEGDDFTFVVEVTGTPKPLCKWTKDGQSINTNDERFMSQESNGVHMLGIRGVKNEDKGTYVAEFTNRAGDKKVQSELHVYSLEELKIPKVLGNLHDKKAKKGENTFFQIKIRGDPKPNVKWYFNDNEIENNEHFTMTQKDDEHLYRLDIMKLNEDHYGKIKVVATNENGEDSKEAKLEVQFEPEIICASEVKAGPGDTVKISFQVKAFPSADVEFYRLNAHNENEEPIREQIQAGNESQRRFRLEMESEEYIEIHSIILRDVEINDGGQFECVAKNRVGVKSATTSLLVITEKPSFIQELKNVTTALGATESFEVIVKGIPKPLTSWTLNDKEIIKDKRMIFDIVELENERGTRYQMTLRDIVFKDFGTLGCKASNMVGDAESSCIFQIIQIPPRIVADFPKMLELKEGDDLILSASINGSPPPTAIWLFEGVEIVPDGKRIFIVNELSEDGFEMTTTLRILGALDEDNGKISLFVSNTAGDVKEDVLVDVVGKPKAPKVVQEIEPQEMTLSGNKDLRLNCKIVGCPLPTIKWYRDGNEILIRKGVLISQDGSGRASLVIQKCQMSDGGLYSAIGVNPLGEDKTSSFITISTPCDEPKFNCLLNSIRAVEGSPVKLEGKMSGHPRPEVKWLKNEGEFIPDESRVHSYLQEDGSFGLVFERSVQDDKGIYTAIAFNSEGSARSNATLTIKSRLKEGVDKSPPSFGRNLGDVAVDEGQKLRFTTPIKGNPIPRFSWSKNGAPISDERTHCFSDGELIGIEILNAKMEDSGVYECHLSNEMGTMTGVTNVVVNKIYGPPYFSRKLNNIKQIPNVDGRFICEVGSNPSPTIDWSFNGVSLSDGGRYKISRNGNLRSLTIKNLTYQDAGSYKCMASNREGAAESIGILEVVEFIEGKGGKAPEFMKKIGDELVFRGMSARFTALISGSPEPDYEFFFNGQPLFPNERVHIGRERSGLIRLSMPYVEEFDIGVYGLKISNEFGEAYCEARLIYDGLEVVNGQSLGHLYQGFEKYTLTSLPMPLPDKPLITRMSDTSVTLTWKPSIALGHNLAPYYMVEMAEYPEGDWTEMIANVRGIVCDINNLTPLRDYRFRVSVRNRFGLSDPSPYSVAHRSKLAFEENENDSIPYDDSFFNLFESTQFPKGFDIYKEPSEGYTCPPIFLKQTDNCQYAVKNSCPTLLWNLYGFPMPSVYFKFNGKEIVMGKDKYSYNYGRNGIVGLTISEFNSEDVGDYECIASNDFGEGCQSLSLIMALYPEFLKAPNDVILVGVNGGKIECEIFGVPTPKIKWFKDFAPLRENCRIQAHSYPPQTHTLYFQDYITKDEGLYTVTASNLCGSITYSVIVRILEDELEYDWMSYRRSKVIIPKSKGFEKFYHCAEELGRGTQGVTYFVQQTIPIEADQSGHHAIEEAESKYWWLHRSVKSSAPTIDPVMVPYRFTGGNFAAKMMTGGWPYKAMMTHEFEIMNVLHHPRLIRLIDVYESKENMNLITELAAGGELLDVLTSKKYISEKEIARLVNQILEGLEYMHSKNIAHLGLTPLDVLFSRPGGNDIKITDFSLSKRIVGMVKLDYGQPEYVAPEIVNGEGATFASDLWPVGIMTYLLLSGVSPFKGQNDRETLQRIQMGDIDFDFELWQNISREAKHFVANLLVYKPEERMSVKQALSHPWLLFLKQPGLETSHEYQISTERLRTYYGGLKEWYANASCDVIYRRRPLSGAFTHPSCMVYPRNEPESKFENEKSPLIAPQWSRPEYTINSFSNPSNYQYGPDTYLLQLKDAEFPARLREYLKVAKNASSEFADVQMPIVKERRRFTDVMEEEMERERESRLAAWGREDYSHFKKSILNTSQTLSLHESLEEVLDGTLPFFREKPMDVALTEGEPLELVCLVAGSPKPVLSWLKNDIVLLDDDRLSTRCTKEGYHSLIINPAVSSDVGLYQILARNPLGTITANIRVLLGDISDSPESPSIEAMTETEILVSWKTPLKCNNAPILAYKLQMGYIDTDIDWVDLADDIRHEYFVVENLRPSNGYKFRVSALNKFGWSIPSIPSQIVMTLLSGSNTSEFYDVLQSLQAREDIEDFEDKISYEIEKNPIQIKHESPGKIDFLNELSKGRFSTTANVNFNGQICTVKIFDKSSFEGENAFRREFKNLRGLKHEKMVSLIEAFETNKMVLFKFNTLPGSDVLSYLAEKNYYTENMVADIGSQILDALDYIHWKGRVYLNVDPSNIIVYSGRSLGKTLQVKLVNFETTQTVSKTGSSVKGTYNFDYAAPEILEETMAYPQSDIWSFGVLLYVLLSAHYPFKGESIQETQNNILRIRFKFEWLYNETTMEASRLLMWIFKRLPFKRPSIDEVRKHKWLNPGDYMKQKRERSVFTTNRIKSFYEETRRSRNTMELDSNSFICKMLE